MSSIRYETTSLCNQIRRIGSLPTSASTFTDDDLTAIMNMELQASVVPIIQTAREEYFVIADTVTVAANVATIDIASEAIGMRIRDLAVASGNSLQYIPRVTPELYNSSFGYYIQNNQIILCAPFTTETTFIVKYYKRPNDLTTETVKVVSKGAGTTINVDNIPDTWGTISNNITIDVIDKSVPFIGKKYNVSSTITGASAISVTAEAYALIEVGDYIALEGTSPVPQYIPVEAHHLMVQGANTRCLEALGDKDGYKAAAVKFAQMTEALISIINPRVESQSKKVITNRTLHSMITGR